jgi:hypothetical protein
VTAGSGRLRPDSSFQPSDIDAARAWALAAISGTICAAESVMDGVFMRLLDLFFVSLDQPS